MAIIIFNPLAVDLWPPPPNTCLYFYFKIFFTETIDILTITSPPYASPVLWLAPSIPILSLYPLFVQQLPSRLTPTVQLAKLVFVYLFQPLLVIVPPLHSLQLPYLHIKTLLSFINFFTLMTTLLLTLNTSRHNLMMTYKN